MKLWLSRQRDGNYMLTAYRPRMAKITGLLDREDLYVRPGDPIGIRHLCVEGILKVSGIELDPLESTKVELTIKKI